MKAIITREELERAYKEINRCPCCGSTDPMHSCGCSPEVFQNRLNEIEVNVTNLKQ